jgi:hypothetical protein
MQFKGGIVRTKSVNNILANRIKGLDLIYSLFVNHICRRVKRGLLIFLISVVMV